MDAKVVFRSASDDERAGVILKTAFRISSARALAALSRGGVRRQHLADLANTGLAVRSRLTARLDLFERACSATNLVADAAVGDTLADADEHGGNLALKIIFKDHR